jgi:diguanylate cyclase
LPEDAEWKQKYRDSVIEMGAAEDRWRHIEKVLRQLVNRLCAAGMGVHARLDDELTNVAAANRRNASVAELETLTASLTRAVADVDQVAPVSNPASTQVLSTRWESTCAAVAYVLERVSLNEVEESAVKALRLELGRARTDPELAKVLRRTADLIQERRDVVARERLQAAAVLAAVSNGLHELVDYFSVSADSHRLSQADAEALDAGLLSQVRELSKGSQSAVDLGELQNLVSAGLQSVALCVREFRARADARRGEEAVRMQEMRGRVAALEIETQGLNAKLAQERDRARVDPLTNVANRKAFDEHMAQEIARRSHTDGPVALLLWDVDDFKGINDGFGHRAGDRVLQSVGRCFSSGVRPTDFVARIGGEEFAIVLVGLPLDAATRIADQLRSSVEALRFHFRGEPVRVTASCGITEVLEGDSAEGAFDRADAALYRAKSGGKNAVIAA